MGYWASPFNLMGAAARGASTASLWTGNMIYTGIQNARTKKEVRELYRHASDSNFQNRSVAVLPGVSKQQLLLTSAEPDDNDVYDYKSNSPTAALDYIWGENDDPEGIIVSGGQNNERVSALIPFVHKIQAKGIPFFVLHSGNSALEKMVCSHSTDCEIISAKGTFYDVFRGMPVDDIAYLLYESMPDDQATPAAESLLRALIEVLLRSIGNVTLSNLAAYPIMSLKTDIDQMYGKGAFDADEYAEITQYYMAGAAESGAVRIFLNKLNRQAENVYGKGNSRQSNIKRMLNRKGAICVDVGSSSNELLVSLITNHIDYIQAQGKQFALLLDGFPLSHYQKLCDVLRGKIYAISNSDFVSSMYGGNTRGDDLFSEMTGNVSTTVLFKHNSGTTCQKWSEYLGKYRKIRIRYNIAQNNAYMNTSNSRGLSVDETDEPRVRAETLSKLPPGTACIYCNSGILIADVKEPT